MKTKILGHVEDLVRAFTYYDRKECEDLSTDDLRKAIVAGDVTIDEITEQFKTSLQDAFPIEAKTTELECVRKHCSFGELRYFRDRELVVREPLSIMSLGYLHNYGIVSFHKYPLKGNKYILIPVSVVVRVPHDCHDYFMAVNKNPIDSIKIDEVENCMIKCTFETLQSNTKKVYTEVLITITEVDGFFQEMINE